MKLDEFFNTNRTDLIQIYLQERSAQGVGVLYVDLTDLKNGNVVYLPITSEYLTDELKENFNKRVKEVSENTIFIYGIENNDSTVKMLEFDIKS